MGKLGLREAGLLAGVAQESKENGVVLRVNRLVHGLPKRLKGRHAETEGGIVQKRLIGGGVTTGEGLAGICASFLVFGVVF